MAQNDRGSVTGTVTDPANATVPGAKLTLRNVDTGVLSAAKTTPTGDYTFTSIPVGTYDLSVEATGFNKSLQTHLQVQIDQTIRMDLRLQVGASTESVTVTADAEILK